MPSDRHPFVRPMLATLIKQAFDHRDWIFEVKWDGYRAIAEVRRREVHLYSRRGLSFADRFRPIVEELSQWRRDAILDGELAILDEHGRSDFQALQNGRQGRHGLLAYCVFDLLALDGKSMRDRPLLERKARLQDIVPQSRRLRFVEHVEQHGEAFFRVTAEHGLEGIVAKRASSRYQDGQRSRHWLKLKHRKRGEAVIVGYTCAGRYLDSLILAAKDRSQLVYVGEVGFIQRRAAELAEVLPGLKRDTCPLLRRPRVPAARWVEPLLVCEVEFQEWTQDGVMRHPVFLGLRTQPTEPPRNRRRELARSTHSPRS